MDAVSPVQLLHRKLAAAVELFAREEAVGEGGVLLIGNWPDDLSRGLVAALGTRIVVKASTVAEIGERARPAQLVAVAALSMANDAATMSARFAVALRPGGLLLAEVATAERSRWRQALEAAGFGEFRMRNGAVENADATVREIVMARLMRKTAETTRTSVTPIAVATATAQNAGRVDRMAVQAAVQGTLERLLRLSPGDLDPVSPFSEYGVDSIAGVAFVNELNRVLQLDLKPMVLFDYTSVAKLAAFIAEQCAPVLPGVAKGQERSTNGSHPAPVAETPASASTPSLPVSAVVAQTRAAPSSASPAPNPQVAAHSSTAARESDVAVVGMAGRFPGAANVDEFWRNLRAGISSITEVPGDRWDHSKVYDPQAKRPDKTPFKWGGFIADADKFDPLFFAISGREAEATDPQQRVFLEACYHALEDAGYAGESARKARKFGVFAGVEPGDYMGLFTSTAGVTEKAPLFQGNAESILAARISYFLDLRGPSLAINTACSSSLVAIHLACQSIVRGECDMALAGGVRVFATEKAYLALGNMGMLAADGRCKTFDAAADGFVPGEAVGVLVLKSLSAALRDGDTIHGVIKGSAINQDGRTNGITAPSSLAQTEVQREAYERAGVSPATFDYVESHGTGTKLGDPIEVQALTNTFRHYTSDTGFCALGAVKTNIGHTMAAAGVCGVIKVLLALRHREIPPSLNLAQTNPYIDFGTSPFRPASALEAWPATSDRPRRAAVSSFGFSGTNSHAVIEEAPALERASRQSAKSAHLIVLSARTKEALQRLVANTAEVLFPEMELADVAFTLAVGRGHFEERVALVVGSTSELKDVLQRLVRGEKSAQAWRGSVTVGKADPADVVIHRQLADITLRELETLNDADAYREKLAVIGALYAKGAELSWQRVFGSEKRRRISLPGYPFARERYWAPVQLASAPVIATPSGNQASPISHSGDASRQLLTGEEFFLSGHVVNGRRTLPGVMYLELVRRAWRIQKGDTATFQLVNVAWKRPLVIESALQASITLVADSSGSAFSVQVGDVVHAEGRLRPIPTRAREVMDLVALRGRCSRAGDATQLYAQCRTAGLALGEGMRAIREIRFSDTEALARLEVDAEQAAEFGWHPGLLDGALQTTAALGDGQGGGLPVPFAVGEMWADRLPSQCWAYVQREPAKGGVLQFRISLLDDDGVVLGRFERMAMRALVAASSPTKDVGSEAIWIKPGWQDSTIEWGAERELVGTLLAVGGGQAWSDALQAGAPGLEVAVAELRRGEDWAARLRGVRVDFVVVKWPPGAELEESALAVFELVQALVRGAGEQSVEILIVHAPGENLAAAGAGFGRTLRLEKPNLHLRAVELADGDVSAILAELTRKDRVARVRLATGRRSAETVELVTADATKAKAAVWRERGVYLISGGAGGLGVLLAKRLAGQYQARLVLLGRSVANAKTDRLLAEIEALGGTALYVQADVSREEEVAAAIAQTKAVFGALHGVIHAAGVIEDGFVREKDLAAVERVFRSKVRGALALDAATRAEPLDFFAAFSSIAGTLGNVGQADYAWANCFLDEFAETRSRAQTRGERNGMTVSIAWPLWRDGGMQQGGEMERVKLARVGLSALATEQGLALLDQALTMGAPRLALLVGRGEAIRALLTAPNAAAKTQESAGKAEAAPVEAIGSAVASGDARAAVQAWLTARFAELVKLPVARIQPADALEKYGIDSVMVMDFTQRLETEFGELSKTLLFEHQTLAELAEYFSTQHAAAVARLAGHDRAIAASEETPVPVPVVVSAAGPSIASTTVAAASGLAPVSTAEKSATVANYAATNSSPPAAPDANDIAIIGVAGRYPMAGDVDAFWENLRAGRDCIVEIPAERWDYRAFYDPETGKLGKTKNKWGGFLDGVERFDATFFGVTPREAMALDPQERIFLQTAWQALEDAGYRKSALTNRPVGVFVGVMYGEYQLYGAGDVAGGRVLPLSSSYASIANRVSYFFNWHGPSMAIDTMCSSSLTAIHLACASLVRGETELALAGGVNATLHPHKDMLLAPGGFAASDGRCRSFGEGGDGYVPGEGVGALLLKPLAKALADGDHVWGVIKATAVNHGGKTNGYTVPNPKSQAEVVGTALARSGLKAGEVSYIEAHGTGTALGDPIEISALARALGSTKSPMGTNREVCVVGSVKSNIGHLESAAGVAGVTKVLLQMRHGQIAPSLHSAKLNPNIRFDETGFRVPQALETWPRSAAQPRRAGVSSFGAGGSNAHVVLEEFVAPSGGRERGGSPQLVVLSAKTEDRLLARAQQLAIWVEANAAHVSLADVAWTLQVGREPLDERVALVAESLADLARRLKAFASGDTAAARAYRGRVKSGGDTHAEPMFAGEEGAAFLTALVRQGKREKLAQLWAQGVEIAWEEIRHDQPAARRISLPVYPFLGERYWAPERLAAESRTAANAAGVAPAVSAARPVVSESAGKAAPFAAEAVFLRPTWSEQPLASHTASLRGRLWLVGGEVSSAEVIRAAYPDIEVTTFSAATDFREVFPAADSSSRKHSAPPEYLIWVASRVTGTKPALETGLYGLVRWTQALLARGATPPVKVLFCHPPGMPLHAAVTGWARTLAQEQPNVQVTVVETERVDAELVAELAETVESREVRRAGAKRWVRTLEPLALETASGAPGAGVKTRGVYLLSGGLGGVGKILALHLAQKHHARLLIVGRSPLGAVQSQALQEIESAGGEAAYFQADASRRDDAFAAAAKCREVFGSIDGVIHAAGVLRDGYALRKSVADYSAVLAPKVFGATWLDEATANDRLDFFALFSSTAGTFGNVGQADYAFANAFLDACAEQRQADVVAGRRSGRTVAIGWPLWRDGGMPVGPEVTARLAQAGLAPLPADVGVQWFEASVAANEPRIIPLWGSRERVLALFARKPAVSSSSMTIAKSTTSAARTNGVSAVAAAAPDIEARIETYLRETLGAVIQLDAEKIDPEVRFDEIGVDSIVVNDVNQRFERDLGAVSKTLLFEHPNIRRLARFLASTQAEGFARLWAGSESSAAEQTVATLPVQELPRATPAEPAGTTPAQRGTATPETTATGIAVIGLAGRFPGAADVHRFWDVLREGRDCVTEIPAERWDIGAHFDADPAKAVDGKMYGRWGAFLGDVDKFDPLFFNLSPIEAEMMDPQERLFLEVAWHALEDAGYTRRELRRWAKREFAANVGVFVGVTSNSYSLLGHAAGGDRAAPTSLPWSLANRVSYLFNFNGPSMPVDTACSSSLTAVHLAVEAIRRGECQQAIAGGVNLYLHPSKYSHLSMMKMLSTDGKCRAFGDGGDGFVPGEGAGAVLLKPLAKALADGDRIWGVIKGTAVNHGGRTNGYTVPSPAAQADLVTQALASAQIDPATISYIEAHGTGTALGDPIEIDGLARAFSAGASDKANRGTCAIGSVKTNIGHLESASGIAGLAKVLLQLRHGELAPSLHTAPVNPRIDFSTTPFRVQSALSAWERPRVGGATIPRRAGISSFGAGGSNAHVIVEEAPDRLQVIEASSEAVRAEVLVVLSAKNRARLRATAAGLLEYLTTEIDATKSLASFAWSLQVGRDALEERVAFLAANWDDLYSRLRQVADDRDDADGTDRFWRGRVKRERVLASVEEASAERMPVDGWRQAAAKWLAGGDIDWRSLYRGAAPLRVSLPGYAFARERYWLPDVAGVTVRVSSTAPANSTSTAADKAVVAAGVKEFPLRIRRTDYVLADHVVQGAAVLPGAATLELARAAAADWLGTAGSVELRNVVWQRPIVDSGDGISATLRLRRENSGGAFEFLGATGEVFTQGAITTPAGRNGANAHVDLAALRAKCGRQIEAAAMYAGFAARGIRYGDAFQVIRALRVGEGEALAELEIPAVWAGGGGALHPALVDGALQTLAAVGAGEGGLEIPFAVAEVACFEACPRVCLTHVKRAAESAAGRRYDLRLIATDGRVLAALNGVAVRRYEGAGTMQPAADVRFGRVAWKPEARAHSAAVNGAVLVIGGSDTWAVSRQNGVRVVRAAAHAADTECERVLREAQPVAIVHAAAQAGVSSDEALNVGMLSLQRWVRASIRILGTKPAPLAFVFADGEPAFAAAGGYVRSLRLEHPGWRLTTLAARGAVSLDEVLAEVAGTGGDICLDAVRGDRAVRALEERPLASLQTSAFRRGGGYVITGGMGGLGRLFTEHLVTHYEARVVLVGRSEPALDKQAWLAQLGARASYVRADLAQPGVARQILRSAVTTLGRVDGVLHAAGILRDGLARDRSEADFRALADVKIYAAQALADAAGQVGCPWVTVFSSTAGVFGNAGQSVYAFANAWLDAWAETRKSENGVRVVSVAWPMWKHGGMEASEAALRFQAETLGMLPLENSEGIAALERILASDAASCVVVKATATFAQAKAGGSGKVAPANASATPSKAAAPANPDLATVTPAAATSAGAPNLLKQVVADLRAMAAKVLRIDEALLDPETDTAEYGFDSVTFTSLSNEVNRAFELEVTPAVFFEHRTLASFAEYLWTDQRAKVQAKYPATAVAIEPNAAAAVTAPATAATPVTISASDSIFAAAPIATTTPTQPAAASAPAISTPPRIAHSPSRREPVAIVGMSGVFPGAPDLATFWRNLDAGHDAIGKPALERWVTRPGEDLPWGGFMADVDKFDALFFDISPREAELMDPQQRLFLQTVWRAIEDAGYRKSDFAGTKTGLFVGVAANDYANVLAHAGVEVEAYSSTGNAHSVLANRVSYFFDLNGPSEAIDTACSSSLVAIHRAIESIECGSSEMAIVGGVNALLSPAGFTAFTRAGMLCVDGRCKTFDARANGYVRGEGVGALVLKPLSRALRDGDQIYATIRGSAENHGGHVQSLTVPNPNAQARLLQDAWARADIAPETIGFIEAHGTGTALGDPIEINGLKKAFAQARGSAGDREGATSAASADLAVRCAVGSVKTNIGHLETAAGIAGVIKVLLAMRHERIPGNVHLATLNPYIQVEGTPFYFPQASEPWARKRDRDGRELPRRAGVSSFGFGGANAHVVLEEWQDNATRKSDGSVHAGARAELFLLSARDAERLRESADGLRQFVADVKGAPSALAEVAQTLQLGRESLAERIAFTATTREELAEKLGRIAAGDFSSVGWTGNTSENGAATKLLRELHREPATLAPWLKARDFTKLAALWTAGVEIDWRHLYADTSLRRVRLPGYPFARTRYWVPAGAKGVAALGAFGARSESSVEARPHLAATSAEFAVRIAATECVLADHVVQGTAVLPGAATLEIARAAIVTWSGAEARSVTLRNVTWRRPVTGTAAGVSTNVRVRAEQHGAAFEVLDATGGTLADGRADISADGSSVNAERLGLETMRARCGRALAGKDLYTAFAQRGLAYGSAYQVIRDIVWNEHEAVARLELTAVWPETGYRLHPALVDGALQSIAVLGTEGEGLEVPFAVSEVWSAEALPMRCVVHAEVVSSTPGHRSFRITLAREDGTVVARLDGYLLRRLGATAVPAVTPVYLVPEWVPAAGAEPALALRGTCLVFDEGRELAAELTRGGLSVRRLVAASTYREDGDVVWLRPNVAEDYERLLASVGEVGGVIHRWAVATLSRETALQRGIQSVHLLTQALLHTKGGEMRPLLFAYLEGEPLHAAVASYARSVWHEHPGLRWKTVAVELGDWNVKAELAAALEDVRLIGGRREVRSLRAWNPDPVLPHVTARGGVYLITGGAGGLGQLFAEYFVEQRGARVVLTGRSAPDEKLRERLARWQSKALYVAADVSTSEGAVRVVREARAAFGAVTGVLHAAGQLRDGLVVRKRWEDFEAVLRPKAWGAEALDEATLDEPLEWFALFSSSVGLLGNSGQSDYAFANAYLDAFAHRRTREVKEGRRVGRTLSLNWPLWRDGGMRAVDTSRSDQLGLLPLEKAAGIEIFERALAGAEPQVWGFVGNRERVQATLLGATAEPRRSENRSAAATPKQPAVALAGKSRSEIEAGLKLLFSVLSKMPVEQIRISEPLEKYGMDSILAVEFTRRIGEEFGDVPQAVVFEHPSIQALSAYLVNRAAPATPTPLAQSPSVTPPRPTVQVVTLPLPPAPSIASAPAITTSTTVDQGTTRTVATSSPFESRSRRQVALAPIDYTFVAPKRLAMQVLYYFERPLEFAALRKSLLRATESFFPVNAKLEHRGKRAYVIRECIDAPDFEEVRCGADVELPIEGQPTTLDPFQTHFDPTQRGEKLAKFRLHQLKRGSILAVHVSHAIADGYSFYYFMSAWAAACRGEPFLVPDHNRGVLRDLVRQHERLRENNDNGSALSAGAAALSEFELTAIDPKLDPTTRRVDTLEFDVAALLDEARRKAGPVEVQKLSENSVLTAHIWKHYAASLREENRELTLSCPVNFRRQSGRFTHAFFGNASAPAVVRLARQHVLDATVSSLAAAITDAVRACDEGTLAAYNAAVERIRRTRGLSGVNRTMLADPRSGLVVTNVARFPLPPMDFGTGPCAADFNLFNYAGTAVIVAGRGDVLKVRIAYPSSTAAQSAVA